MVVGDVGDGVGLGFGQFTGADLGVDAEDLADEETEPAADTLDLVDGKRTVTDAIANVINDPEGHGVPKWFLNRQRDYKEGKNLMIASNVLETKLREDIERMFKIRCNRGLRHKWGLKVRGQHTKTTGRRGKTVGVERRKK